MGEIKTTTIRLSEETIKAFREMAENQGMTQEQCLSNLLNVFEFQQAKDVLKDRKKEIEIFEEYISRIQNLYLTSLEINLTSEESFKKEFNDNLSEKNNIILSLNKEIKELKGNIVNYQTEIKDLNNSLNKKDLSLKSYDELQAQNKFLINKITKDNESLSLKLEEMEKLHINIKEYKDLNINLKSQLSDLNNKIIEKDFYAKSLLNKLEFLQSTVNEYKDRLSSLKKENLEEIQILKDEFSKEKLSVTKELKENLKNYYNLKIDSELKLLLSQKDNEINILKSEIEKLKEKTK